MRFYALILATLLLSMLFLPLFSLLSANEKNEKSVSVALSVKEKEEKDKKEETTTKNETDSETISVLMTGSGKVTDTDMFSYTVGCVAAEMGPLFEEEALKAQAVVSFTYALYMKSRTSDKESDISDDPSVHQSFMTYAEMKKKWGDKYEEYLQKIEKAVEEVEGEYLTYKSDIIKPAYHAISSGKTHNAEDVWGGKCPYLVSRNSEGDKLAPDYISVSEFTEKQLKSALAEYGISEIKFGKTVKTDSGYVKSIELSGRSFSGEELRRELRLRSGSFSVTEKDGAYCFTCYGYGHGVGMSQWGANFMARRGFNYKEILKQYYAGVEIEKK